MRPTEPGGTMVSAGFDGLAAFGLAVADRNPRARSPLRAAMLGGAGRGALLVACLPVLLLSDPLSLGAARAADVTISTPTTGTAGTGGGSPTLGGDGARFMLGETVDVNATVAGGSGGAGGTVGGNGLAGTAGGAGLGFDAGGTANINAAVRGGAGGSGGNSSASSNGGAGGAGGAGLVFRAGAGTVIVDGSVTGGNGGQGGSAADPDYSYGAGGAGGAGMVFSAGGTAIVRGSIQGGSGGSGGSLGTGGAGIVGADLNLTLTGTARVYGASGGWTPANAITFTGGTNRLEFWSGAYVFGDVVAAGTSTFALGGTANGSFDLSLLGPAGSFRGFGTLEKTGTGTWTLSTAPGAPMAWQVSAGTLDLGGTMQTVNSFSLTGGTVRNGTVSSNTGFDLQAGTMSAILDGSGWLAKSGAGDVTLTGVNTYTGATTVSDGRLIVNGSIASSSSLTVNPGGTLGGTGTVGTTVIAGGTLAPGNSIGTLAVVGNLSFSAGSTYAVEVSPAASDRVNVTGTATLGGATVAASFAAGTYVARQYTILNATGGVSGTFGSKVDTNLPAGFKSSLGYDANNAYLDLALDFTPTPAQTPTPTPTSTPATPKSPLPNSGLNPNQTAAANALTNFFDRTGGIPVVFGSLTPAGLSQVAGESATGTPQTSVNAMGQFMASLADVSPEGRGVSIAPGPTGFAAYSSSNGKGGDLPAKKLPLTADPDAWRWSVWAGGFGAAQFVGADAGAGTAASTNRIYGGIVGADYRISQDTIAGFALGGGATSFNTYGLGSGSSDLFQAGAFIRQQLGKSYVKAALGYAWQDVTTDRFVTGADHLQARFNANTWSGRVEAGHRFGLTAFGVTPYAAAQITTVALPGYTETALSGASTFALSYAAKDTTRTRSELGLRADADLAIAHMPLKLQGGLAWIHNYDTGNSAVTSFLTLPGATFSVNGAALDRNALRTTASAELTLGKGFSLAALFEGEFADNSRSFGGKGALRYSW